MYFREYKILNKSTGKHDIYHSLVSTDNSGPKPRQVVELTLGRDFDLEKRLWRPVAKRIDEILAGKGRLFPLPEEIESKAQEMTQKVLERRANPKPPRLRPKVIKPARPLISSRRGRKKPASQT